MNERTSIDVGGWTVTPALNRLERGGHALKLEPRTIELLVYLIHHAGQVVSTDRIMTDVWHGRVVEDSAVYKRVNELRKAFGDDAHAPRFIETIPKRGYRLVAPVAILKPEISEGALPARAVPSTAPGPIDAGLNDAQPGTHRRLSLATIGFAAIVLTAMVAGSDVWQRSTPARVVPSQTAVAAVVEKSVAVLPFADLSEGGDQQWLADGLTEDIRNSLAQLPELQVTGRTSSSQFGGENRDTGEIGAILGVTYVLEGSVRRIGDELRVSAELIRARDGFHVWSTVHDGTTSDLFDFQRELAEKAASALDVVLDEKRRERMFRSGTRNVEAFEAYQRGWAIYQAVHYGKTDQTLWDANRHFEHAMALDPYYAEPAMVHMDVFAHQVVRGPGEYAVNSPYSQEEALALMLKDIDFASVNARSSTEWLVAEISREVFSPTWYRLPDLIERLRADGDLNRVNIETAGALTFILRVTGNLDFLRELADRQLAIDRLAVESWIAKAHVELIAGDIVATHDVVRQARRTLGAQEAVGSVELFAAVLQGRRSELIRLLGDPPTPGPYLMALRGDYETAMRLTSERENDPHWLASSLGCLLAYNEMGTADRTRQLVERIDRLPGGSAVFVSFLAATGNALLFDLNDTPNFAAQLQQAGMEGATFKRVPRSTLE